MRLGAGDFLLSVLLKTLVARLDVFLLLGGEGGGIGRGRCAGGFFVPRREWKNRKSIR